MTLQEVKSTGCYVQHQFLDEGHIDELKKFFQLPESRPGVVEFKKADIENSESVVLSDLFRDIVNCGFRPQLRILSMHLKLKHHLSYLT
jgi:hypothetical protein